MHREDLPVVVLVKNLLPLLLFLLDLLLVGYFVADNDNPVEALRAIIAAMLAASINRPVRFSGLSSETVGVYALSLLQTE